MAEKSSYIMEFHLYAYIKVLTEFFALSLVSAFTYSYGQWVHFQGEQLCHFHFAFLFNEVDS